MSEIEDLIPFEGNKEFSFLYTPPFWTEPLLNRMRFILTWYKWHICWLMQLGICPKVFLHFVIVLSQESWPCDDLTYHSVYFETAYFFKKCVLNRHVLQSCHNIHFSLCYSNFHVQPLSSTKTELKILVLSNSMRVLPMSWVQFRFEFRFCQ